VRGDLRRSIVVRGRPALARLIPPYVTVNSCPPAASPAVTQPFEGSGGGDEANAAVDINSATNRIRAVLWFIRNCFESCRIAKTPTRSRGEKRTQATLCESRSIRTEDSGADADPTGARPKRPREAYYFCRCVPPCRSRARAKWVAAAWQREQCSRRLPSRVEGANESASCGISKGSGSAGSERVSTLLHGGALDGSTLAEEAGSAEG
jgi:hypothetical protein